MQKIRWEGFADIDLIEDPRDNIVKIMEINPRLPACNMVSLKSGVDFAENIIDLTAKNTLVKHSNQTEVYLRYFALDLLWILKTKFSVNKTRFWLQKFTNRNHHFQDLTLDDILPFVFGTIGNIIKQLSPKFSNSKKGMQ